MVWSWVLIYFNSPQFSIQQKNKLYKNLIYWSRDTLNFKFSEKGLGPVSPPRFVYYFSTKMFLEFYLLLTNFRSLIFFTYRYIAGQYVYYNCLLTRLWRYKTWNWPYLANQVVLLHDQIVKTKVLISWEQIELLKWNKKHFSSF